MTDRRSESSVSQREMEVLAAITKLSMLFSVLMVSALSACPKDHGRGGSFDGSVGPRPTSSDILKSESTPYLMEDVVLNLIETLKDMLREGIPSLGIPPLDPLDVEHQEIRIDMKDVLLLNGSVSDVLGVNMLSFNASKLRISLIPLSFEIRFDWDSVHVQGKYDIDGAFLSVVPVYGNGSFEGDFSGMYFYFRIDIGTKAAEVEVKNLDLDIGIETVNLKLENFLGGALGDAICEMISEIFPQIVRQLKVAYLTDVKNGIKAVLGSFLEGKTMQDLIDFLMGFLG